MRRPTMAAIGAAVVALAAGGALGGQFGIAAAASPPAGAALPQFKVQQQIDWHSCTSNASDDVAKALDAAGGDCAEITVPLDYRRPSGPTIPIAISRIKAWDDSGRRGVVLLNPGGPGGSGLIMPLLLKTSPRISAGYDLIGFDPRFAGVSAGLDCGWPVSASMRGAGPNKKTYAQSVALAKQLATLCADKKSVLPYASTRNTARDMDVIRTALDESKISYVGYSYGSYLGAVYLQMFPARADRFVLDSNVNPTAYGPALFAQNAPAMNGALKNWAAFAAKGNGTYKLGTSSKQVLANVDLIRKYVDKRPLKLGEHTVDSHVLPLLLWVPDDSIQALETQSVIVKVLRDAAKGVKVNPPKALTDGLDYINSGQGSALISAQAAVLCSDRAADRSTASYLKDIDRHRKAEPIFGPLARNIGPCAFWPTKPIEPLTTIRNSHPALLLNSVGDMQTPYAGAKVMHRVLRGSRLVTLRGAYRHGIFLTGGSNCADAAVERYLVDGVLPRADLTCGTDRSTALPTQLGIAGKIPTTSPGPAGDGRQWPWQSKYSW